MKRQILISSLVLLFTASFAMAESSPYKPGELLVRFANPAASIETKNSIINSALGCSCSPVVKEYSIVPGLALIQLPSGMTVEQARVTLMQSMDILYTGPNYKITVAVIPNDTRFSELWAMQNTGQAGGTADADIDAPEAWNINTGSSNIIVAVTDTGVDYTHLDLMANRWVNTGEIPDNGLDDDDNGYTDDYYGYDFFNGDGDPMDDNGHGTHVAGTIGAVGNNNRGVTGVCWSVKIMALKWLDDEGGGYLDDAVSAIQYATAMGARVINASWRGYFSQQDSLPLYNAIAAARDAGVIFVAAAGNEALNNDTTVPPANPASYDLANIIAVMASTNTDGVAYYSNYGATSVDIAAPGGAQQYEDDPRGILSTLPGNQYGFYQGTSMAAPHVSGACALLLSADSGMTYAEVKNYLMDYSDPLPSLAGLCVSGGRLNLYRALYETVYDSVPPSPDPAEWELVPRATGWHTIAMKAAKANDRSGVEYFFECAEDSNFDSGWQDSSLYEQGDFSGNTAYTFRVKYRDKSTFHNEADWSDPCSTTTDNEPNDTLPPFPSPSRWETKPRVLRLLPTPRVRMEAAASYDENGPVEYYFTCIDVDGGGPNPALDSDWQESRIYTISSGIPTGHTYTFTVKARDGVLPAHNETDESDPASVTVGAQGSNILTVPVPYSTIQAAINAASHGDIVEVRPGTYRGFGNRDVYFAGKAITVRSINPNDPDVVAATIIDVEEAERLLLGLPVFSHRAFEFTSNEGADSILAGFTIKNGLIFSYAGSASGLGGNGYDGSNEGGAAITCGNTSSAKGSPTIRDCVISDCIVFGGFGGYGMPGLPQDPSDPNSVEIPGGKGGRGGDGMGGAIYSAPDSHPAIINCTVGSCYAFGGSGGDGGNGEIDIPPQDGTGGDANDGGNGLGGGIYCSSSATISNCTVIYCITYPGEGGSGGDGAVQGQDGVPGDASHGGGIYYHTNYVADTIDSIVIENQAYHNGGGIYCLLNSQPVLTGCQISGNSCGYDGAGIFYEQGQSLTLHNCTVSDNIVSDDSDGGGIYAGDVGFTTTVTIDDNSTISNNTAGFGAGLFIIRADLTVSDSTISDNYAITEGAGLWAYKCTADINNCTVKDNSAGLGGGLSIIMGLATVNNSLFTGNSADGPGGTGGGIFFEGWSDYPHKVNNCLITDNTADADGAGVSNNEGSWVQLTNCTLADNEVTSADGAGGGLSCAEYWAWAELINSIVWDNSANYGPQISVGTPFGSNPFGPDAFVDVNYSDVEGGEDDVFIEDPYYTDLWWMPGSFDADPLFAQPTAEQTYFLSQIAAGQLQDSPCVDTGLGDACDLESIIGFPLTTRTDYVADVNVVDIGYHYRAGLGVHKYQLTIEVVNRGYGTFGTVDANLPPLVTVKDSNTYDVNQGRVVDLHADPNTGWEVLQWTGADYLPVNPADHNYNTVTMSSDKKVTVEFGPHNAYRLITHVIGNGKLQYIDPNGDTVDHPGQTIHPPGTVVSLVVVSYNPSEVIIWTGTDDDYSDSSHNTVTMDTHKEVTVEFYAPVTHYVPGDYSTIQAAIDSARDGDIIQLFAMGSDQPYFSSLGYNIIGKAITITSSNPDDPCCVADTVIEEQVGPGDYAGPAFYFEDVGRNTVLNGITLRGWSRRGLDGLDADDFDDPNIWDGAPGNRVYGGAMALVSASPTIRNCIITDCNIVGGNGGVGRDGDDGHPNGGNGGWPGGTYGGALACVYASSPDVINCTFSNNIVVGGNGGNGGNGNGDPNRGNGGRGGGYYYGEGNPVYEPWEWEGYYFDDDYNKPSRYSGRGGAVYVGMYSEPTFTHCTFINNRSIGGLNGICGQDGQPVPLRQEPSIARKIDNMGGAVFCDDFSNAAFVECMFSNNVADTSTDPSNDDPYASYGGAAAFTDSANVSFEGCTFNDNVACIGGGMYWNWAELQIDDCYFVGNSAFHGGGVLFVGGTVTIAKGYFTENEATAAGGQGGAICCLGANAEIVDCEIANNNTNGSGGGICISSKDISGQMVSGENTVLVKNCLITDNFASRDGGGISANWYSEPNIVNCTIAGNRVTGTGFEAGYGGGVYCSYNSYANIINSIIWGNSSNIGSYGAQIAVATGFKYDPRPSTVNVTYSDVQDANDPNAFGAVIDAIDLVFCIDSTGSMGDDIDAVKAAASQITSAIATKIPDYRIAVIDYKDFNQPNLDPAITVPYGGADDYPYDTVLGFTTNTNSVIAALNSLAASGGGDGPESVYTGLMHCIDHNSLAATLGGQLYGASEDSLGPGPWRHGKVMRVVILMGDAPPHDPEPFTNYTLEDVVAAADGIEQIRIVSLLVGGDVEAAGYFESLATDTGGTVLQAAGAEEVVQALMDAIDLISKIPDPIFVDANCAFNWDPNSYSWEPNSHNINKDPCFVSGYYLSQLRAGQNVDSPCVDKGSADANDPNISLDTYTTRTDSVPDVNLVDMGYHYEVGAVQQYSLTIEVVGGVGGSLFAIGGGDDSFTIEDPNVRLVNAGTVVSLQALADAGYALLQWTGTDDDTSIDPNNTVTMDSDKVVKVEFYQFTLTIDVYTGGDFEPNGTIIASSSLGTDLFTLTARNEPNSRQVTPGAVIDLSAIADVNYRVWWWSGTDNDGSTDANNTVTINSDKTVTVAFEPDGLYYLIVHITGNGTVTPSGRTLHAPGEVVTLTATPADPTRVVIWTGTDDDFSESYQNTITMNETKEVTVEFYSPRTLYVPGEYPTIQAAIDAADDRDIIELAATGTDQPYITSWGYIISGKAITITSSNPDDPCVVAATVIEKEVGDDAGSGRMCFQFNNVGRNTVLNGITIRDFDGRAANGLDGNPQYGYYDGVPGGDAFGGAILCLFNASPTIKNCIIRDCNIYGGDGGNGAAGNVNEGHLDGGHGGWPGRAYGGAMAMLYNCSPLIVNCTFINNSAIGGNGGDGGTGAPEPDCGNGGRGGGYYYSDPPMYPYFWEPFDNFGIPYNQYTKFSGHGGAVFVGWNSSPEFIDCDFMNNTTGSGTNGISGQHGCPPNLRDEPSIRWKIDNFGGAVYVASGSTASFGKCSFTNNFADTNNLPESSDPFVSFGGAVAFEEGAYLTFENCTFTDNAAAIGGGLYGSHSDLHSDDCNFVGNLAYHGGGALCVGGTAGIAASNFIDNEATATAGRGAGICLLGNNADIIDCTISNNDANGSGGGIYLSNKDIYDQLVDGENTVLVKNCLITGNFASRDGGGISANWYSDPNIVNCTIANNIVTGTGFGAGYGGGLGCFSGNYTNVVNSIFRGNSAQRGPQIAIGTGFEYFKLPSTVNVSYSDVQSGQSYVFVDEDCTLNWGTGNIHINPLFATGPLGDFYLSQIAAGQSQDSPCVNTGGSSAASLGLDGYTTRTDQRPDLETVDMGYHYPFTPEQQPCRFCELVRDGIINFTDFAVFVLHWLDEDCSPANNWCQHSDITFDTYVDFMDVELFARCWLVEDTYPPTPNPSEWATEPYSSPEISPNSISMAAIPAVDAWDYWEGNVQYYFDCVYGGCQDSGWQDEISYTDPNLIPGEEYGYRVRARDASEKIPAGDTQPGNKTGWSPVRYAIVGEKQPDTTPPEPSEMTWATVPTATGTTTITMTATTATDESPPVEYFFECTSDAGASSSWQIGTTYIATGLTPQTQYTFRVKARDGAPAHSETGWSVEAFATTLEEEEPNEPNNPPLDNEAPLPDPPQWLEVPYQYYDANTGYYRHRMAAVVTSDATTGDSEPCQYYFDLVSGGVGPHDSGWQLSNVYDYPVSAINPNQFGYYRVRTKDAADNETELGENDGWSTTLGTHIFP